MSRTPYFYIEKFNRKESKWEKVTLYRFSNEEPEEVELWPFNGTHDLFNLLGYEAGFADYPFEYSHQGLPKDASEEMQKIYNDYFGMWEGETFFVPPTIRWFNYADGLVYLKSHPEVPDYEERDLDFDGSSENKMMDNPIKELLDRVESYLDFADDMWGWDMTPSEVRVIYWVS